MIYPERDPEDLPARAAGAFMGWATLLAGGVSAAETVENLPDGSSSHTRTSEAVLVHRNCLILRVKREWYVQIQEGTKVEEFRLRNAYWQSRIEGKRFNTVAIICGYPAANQPDNRITFPWRGFIVKTILHPFFGEDAVEVFVIV